MLFTQYPYLNLNDLNLDYLLRTLRDLSIRLDNFISLNTIKYANPIQWKITNQYEANTVVIDDNDGTAYLSTAPVPKGVAITNTDYWTPIFRLNLLSANQNITLRDDSSNVLATFASVAGDWLIWNNTLYKVTQAINVNEAYVVGYNLTRYSVEMFISDYITELKNLIGDLNDLDTTDKTDLVSAINELVDAVNAIEINMGDIANLTTTDKSSVVNAINELVSANTTVANRLNNMRIYNVLDYGAIEGEDFTDALKTTLTACGNDGGGIVFIPIGTYYLSEQIDVYTYGINIQIMGEATWGTYIFATNALTGAMFSYDGAQSSSGHTSLIANLTLNDNVNTSTYGIAIRDTVSNPIFIEKVAIMNAWCGILLSSAHEVFIQNYIYSASPNYVGITKPVSGITCAYHCVDVFIDNSTIIGVDNTNPDNLDAGIAINGADGITISNCRIKARIGIDIINQNNANIDDVYINNNVIDDLRLIGVRIAGSVSGSYRYFNIRLNDNHIDTGISPDTTSAIAISGNPQGIQICGNNIVGNTVGISDTVTSTPLGVSGHMITDNTIAVRTSGQFGINYYPKYGIIANNIFNPLHYGTTFTPINLAANTEHVVCEGNVTSPSGGSVVNSGTGNVVANNT